MKDLIGRTLSGRYLVDCVVAKAAAGPVFLGRNLEEKKRVALKLFSPESLRSAGAAERYEQEARVGSRIDHPHVAGAFDFGTLDDGSRFLVMEYVRGRTLRALMDAEAPLPSERVVRISRQLALGLEHLHDRGVIHRQLEPANVLVTDQDFVKLVDFGVAKVDAERIRVLPPLASDTGAELARAPRGAAPAYLAPEATFGLDVVDSRADLYAVGVLAYEMLTGKLPYDAKSELELYQKRRQGAPPPMQQRLKGLDLDPTLDGVVMTLLELDPNARYQTAADLVVALDVAVPTVPVQPLPSLPPEPAERRMATPAPSPLAARGAPPVAGGLGAPSAPAALPSHAASPAPPQPPRTQGPAEASSSRDVEVASTPLELKQQEPLPAVAEETPVPDTVDAVARQAPGAPRGRAWLWAPALALVAGAAVFVVWGRGGGDSPPTPSVQSPAAASPGPPPRDATSARSSEPLVEPKEPEKPKAPVVLEPAPEARRDPPPSASVSPQPAVKAGGLPAADLAKRREALPLALKLEQWDTVAKLALVLLQEDPKPFEAKGALELLFDALVGLANTKHTRADDAWAAAAAAEGGPDFLYRVLEVRGKGAAADRARVLLRSAEVKKRMSPGLAISFELREGGCKDRVGLLERAVAEGDQRTSLALKTAVRECVASPEIVDQAIARLRDRLLKAK